MPSSTTRLITDYERQLWVPSSPKIDRSVASRSATHNFTNCRAAKAPKAWMSGSWFGRHSWLSPSSSSVSAKCLSSSRSSLRSGPRKCMARTDSKTKTNRQTLWCGRTSHRWQACHNFCPMWCGALWSHKDSLQWLIALKCKPHSTLQLQIFAESFKLS